VLSLPDVPVPDGFRAVVVRVEFVPAVQAVELLAVTVVLLGEPTISTGTSLAGVTWVDLVNPDTDSGALYSTYSTRLVTRLVRAVEELLSSFVEVVVGLVGDDEFDRRGTPDLRSSSVTSTVLDGLEVRQQQFRHLCRGVSASSPADSLRASDWSEALAP
jgi:hypothetical protein